MKKVLSALLIVLALAIGVSAQLDVDKGQFIVTTNSLTTMYHNEEYPYFLSHTLEIVWTGTPVSPSVFIYGCMRGGTCTPTNIANYSSTTNGLVYFYGLYDSYKITTQWASGATAVTLNVLGHVQPGSASATNGTLALLDTTSMGDGVGTPNKRFYDGAGTQSLAMMAPYVWNGTTADRMMVCPNTTAVSINTASTAELIPLSGTTRIYVCSVSLMAAGTTNVVLQQGTGTTCGTGTLNLTGVYPFAAGVSINMVTGYGYLLRTQANGQALCISNSAAVQVSGFISWARY